MGVIYLCPHCGSDNVVRDAFASWNVETQKWELANVFDDANCENDGCERAGINLDEVPYDCVGKPSTE